MKDVYTHKNQTTTYCHFQGDIHLQIHLFQYIHIQAMYTDLPEVGACNLKHFTMEHYRIETKPVLCKT